MDDEVTRKAPSATRLARFARPRVEHFLGQYESFLGVFKDVPDWQKGYLRYEMLTRFPDDVGAVLEAFKIASNASGAGEVGVPDLDAAIRSLVRSQDARALTHLLMGSHSGERVFTLVVDAILELGAEAEARGFLESRLASHWEHGGFMRRERFSVSRAGPLRALNWDPPTTELAVYACLELSDWAAIRELGAVATPALCRVVQAVSSALLPATNVQPNDPHPGALAAVSLACEIARVLGEIGGRDVLPGLLMVAWLPRDGDCHSGSSALAALRAVGPAAIEALAVLVWDRDDSLASPAVASLANLADDPVSGEPARSVIEKLARAKVLGPCGRERRSAAIRSRVLGDSVLSDIILDASDDGWCRSVAASVLSVDAARHVATALSEALGGGE